MKKVKKSSERNLLRGMGRDRLIRTNGEGGGAEKIVTERERE